MNKNFNKKGPAKNISFQPLPTILQTITQTSNFAQSPKNFTLTWFVCLPPWHPDAGHLCCPALYQNSQISPKLYNYRVQLLISYLPFFNSTIASREVHMGEASGR